MRIIGKKFSELDVATDRALNLEKKDPINDIMVYNKKSRATSDFVAAYEKAQYEDSFNNL